MNRAKRYPRSFTKQFESLVACGRLTAAQLEWFKQYLDDTTFEPMHMREVANGTMTFSECGKINADWFENWMTDAHLSATEWMSVANEGT